MLTRYQISYQLNLSPVVYKQDGWEGGSPQVKGCRGHSKMVAGAEVTLAAAAV